MNPFHPTCKGTMIVIVNSGSHLFEQEIGGDLLLNLLQRDVNVVLDLRHIGGGGYSGQKGPSIIHGLPQSALNGSAQVPCQGPIVRGQRNSNVKA